MRIVLHELAPGQRLSCLDSILEAAQQLALGERMRLTPSAEAVRAWVRRQPFLKDADVLRRGSDGCNPHQRMRPWPQDGLNCVEASIHYSAAVIVHGLPPGAFALHLYDRQALREDLALGHDEEGRPVVLRRGHRHVYPMLEDEAGALHLVDLSSLLPRDRGAALGARAQGRGPSLWAGAGR